MNNFQFNESVRYLTTMNPLFDRFVSKMDDGGAADFFAFWARELESYEMDDFKATVDQISREGWGEWEHPHGLERVMERLRDARAKEVRRERNAEVIAQGYYPENASPGLWDGARTTFQEIENGRQSAKEQIAMLETIYMEVYAEYGIEVKKGGPSGMHAAKLAGKAEEVKAEVRRRWRAWVRETQGVTL